MKEGVAEGRVRRVNELQKPRIGMRCLGCFLILLVVAGPLFFGLLLNPRNRFENMGDFLEATATGLHLLLVLAGGVILHMSMENRVKRNQALETIAANLG